MDKCAGKRKKRYVDRTRERSKLTCLIHVIGHSVYQFKFLNEFDTRYSAIRPFKEHIRYLKDAKGLKKISMRMQ